MESGEVHSLSIEMDGGYHFRYLDIDLNSDSVTVGEPDKALLKNFIGGKGLGLALLCEIDKSNDPLDPENPMIFVTGPLTATKMTTSSRACLVTRSPLTGGFLDSHAGGHFGHAIRGAGYDYIIIRGKAEKPTYLKITKEGIEIEDAGDLWGKGSFETEDILMDRHPKARVASIGPAGENKVRFACINTDKYRQFGRGGAGAVMGSKNLKALVLEGQEKIFIHDEQKFNDLAVGMNKETVKHPERIIRHKLGTPLWIRLGHEKGRFLPTHNFKYGQWKEYESLTSETMEKELKWDSCGCYNCVIKCSKKVTYDGGDFEGPEFETTAFLGSGCEVADARAVVKSNSMCDDLGLDTISCGVTISFAMEAAEKGLLSSEDNEWIKFGSADAVQALVKKIAFREGIGDVLTEGTRIASEIIGQNCDNFAIHIGGMELSGANPLGCYSMALSLATADFASHTRMWSATDEMLGKLELDTLAPYIAAGHDKTNIRNSIIVCDFLPFGLDTLAPMMVAATGYPFSEEDLLLAGERIQTLSRLYNLRTGRSHSDDVLPARFYQEESCGGLMNGKKISGVMFENHVQDYFKFRGWDKEGKPTKETLERLGLSDYAQIGEPSVKATACITCGKPINSSIKPKKENVNEKIFDAYSSSDVCVGDHIWCTDNC